MKETTEINEKYQTDEVAAFPKKFDFTWLDGAVNIRMKNCSPVRKEAGTLRNVRSAAAYESEKSMKLKSSATHHKFWEPYDALVTKAATPEETPL